MKRFSFRFCLFCLLAWLVIGQTLANVRVGLSVGDDGIRSDSRVFVVIDVGLLGRFETELTTLERTDERNTRLVHTETPCWRYLGLSDTGSSSGPCSERFPAGRLAAIGLRFLQGKGGVFETPDNWEISFDSDIKITQDSRTFNARLREPTYRFRGNTLLWFSFSSTARTCQGDGDCKDIGFTLEDDVPSCSSSRETCDPDSLLANEWGCVSRPCDPETDVCDADVDGDGYDSIQCGGGDCDDNDPDRHPGRLEFCDRFDYDEDCNIETFGFHDNDGDGFSQRCCNTDELGNVHCIRPIDCNDFRRKIFPGVQICDPDQPGNVLFCEGTGEFSSIQCGPGLTCVTRPVTAIGVCVATCSCEDPQ